MRRASTTHTAPALHRLVTAAAAVALLGAVATLGLAQYALDRNQRVNTQVSGIGYQRNANIGQRNLYSPGVSYRTQSPYTLNRNTGTYMFNPNTAFSRPVYRPTGYGVAGGSPAYHQRIRYR